MKVIDTFLVAVLVAPIMISMIQADGFVSPVANKNWILADQSAAMDRALAYTGFAKSPGYTADKAARPQLQNGIDDKTPFLSGIISGRPVWVITFPGIYVGRGQQIAARDFEVVLDAANGHLLRIYSVSNVIGSSDTLPEPLSTEAEEKLRSGGMVFHQLPDSLPAVCFLDAAKECFLNPATCKTIRAVYMDYSIGHDDYSKTWVIILRGSEIPMEVSGPHPEQVPMNKRNSQWCAVDGISGKLRYVTNAPSGKRN